MRGTEDTPPQGTVALIFTDVEGSTDLWEHAPDAMRAGLALHDAAMRREIAAHRGYEVKTEGDAFMVSFADPADALRWCLTMQDCLPDLDWPEELLAQRPAGEVREDGALLQRGLRVRMGGHLGAPDCRPDPVTGRMDYFGPVVNRAARVGSAGHGGQIVVSAALLRAAAEQDPSLASRAVDAGLHGMKGLREPEHLYTLSPGRFAPRSFPPLRTQSPTRTNLGREATAFVGRAADLAEVSGALREARLLSLLGPGGMGKTRLAREAARAAAAEHRGGAWFVDLTDARDVDGIVRQTAAVLGAALVEGETPEEASRSLGDLLAGRGPLLLVLDNFEQVAAHATATVGTWLERAPELRCLVTSREALGMAAEERLEVAPLTLEDALELFRSRAGSARRGFTLAGVEEEAARQLVEVLDRMPLAVELAAARVGLLPPSKLLERLGKALDLLKDRSKDAGHRQRTLRTTIEWSWELLEEGERAVLSQLSVFRGGFTLDEVEAVVVPGGEDPDVLDALESLRDKSLVRDLPHPAQPGEPRFGLYETIRAFAEEQLPAPAGRAARVRHAEYFASRGEQLAGRDLDRTGLDEEELNALHAASENLHAAREFTRETDPATSARLAYSLAGLHSIRGPAETRTRMIEEGIEAAHRGGDRETEALLLLDRAGWASLGARFDDARADSDAAAALAETLDDDLLRAEVLSAQVRVLNYSGGTEEADRLAREMREIGRRLGNPGIEAKAVALLGGMYLQMCSWENALEFTEEAARLYHELGNSRLEAMPLLLLGFVRWNHGDGQSARSCYARALDIVRRLGDRPMEAMALQWLGELQVAMGQLEEARETLEDCLAVAREHRVATGETGILFTLSCAEGEAGNLDRAEELGQEALARVQASGEPLMEGALQFYLGALAARQDRIEEAEERIAVGHEKVPAPFVQSEGMALQEAWIDLARARAARRDGDPERVRELLDATQRKLAEVVAPDAEDPTSVDVGARIEGVIGNKRAIVRGLHQALEEARAGMRGGAP